MAADQIPSLQDSTSLGTACSAAGSDYLDDEIASLNSIHRINNRETDSDVGIVMIAASEDANKTPVVRPPPTSRQDSGGYYEMDPPTAATIRKRNSFSPPKGGFSRKSSGPSPSPPPRITSQRPSDTHMLLSPTASIPQGTSSSANEDFFEIDFSGSGGNRT